MKQIAQQLLGGLIILIFLPGLVQAQYVVRAGGAVEGQPIFSLSSQQLVAYSKRVGTLSTGVELINDGNQSLVWQVTSTPEWLSVMPCAGINAALEGTEVEIAYQSEGLTPGVYEGVIRIETNDPQQGVREIPVRYHYRAAVSERVEVSIFPNPVHEKIQLRPVGISAERGQFTLVDALGKIVYQNSVATDVPTTIDISELKLNSGQYYASLAWEGGRWAQSLQVH